jgi:hypothetical protein
MASVLCFAVLWQLVVPSGPNMGIMTLAIAVVSGLVGASLMLTLRGDDE